jgi:hypothetical protein
MDGLRSALMGRSIGRSARMAGVSLAVVLIGSGAVLASLNAWRSRPAPLTHTVGSPEALGRTVFEAFRAGDTARLTALALSEAEFKAHVWPFLPVSRPDRNVPFDFAWGMLHQQSMGYLYQTTGHFRGQELTLVRVEFSGASTTYDDVTVHRDTQLVVRARSGEETIIRLFGSTIEQAGRYKVFSYVVDD